MIATPDDVRKLLEVDDDRLAELRKEQNKALKVFRSRARLTPEERRMGRAIELERHHRITGDNNALAEALAAQGRFREAVEAAEKPELKAALQEKLDAVEKPDENCTCPDFEEINGMQIPNLYIESNVFRDGQVVPAIRCKICKQLNVRPAPPFLLEQRAARAASVANERNQIKATEFFKQ